MVKLEISVQSETTGEIRFQNDLVDSLLLVNFTKIHGININHLASIIFLLNPCNDSKYLTSVV